MATNKQVIEQVRKTITTIDNWRESYDKIGCDDTGATWSAGLLQMLDNKKRELEDVIDMFL